MKVKCDIFSKEKQFTIGWFPILIHEKLNKPYVVIDSKLITGNGKTPTGNQMIQVDLDMFLQMKIDLSSYFYIKQQNLQVGLAENLQSMVVGDFSKGDLSKLPEEKMKAIKNLS